MAVDAVDRKVIFVANGSDIYSMKIDVTNTDLKHVISVVNHTEDITGMFSYLMVHVVIVSLSHQFPPIGV